MQKKLPCAVLGTGTLTQYRPRHYLRLALLGQIFGKPLKMRNRRLAAYFPARTGKLCRVNILGTGTFTSHSTFLSGDYLGDYLSVRPDGCIDHCARAPKR
jgi:hypothetical protein